MKICMVAYTFYESDARVRRYAESLARRGDQVDVIALKCSNLPNREVIQGVTVFRIQKRCHDEKHKLSYLYRLLKFMVRSSVILSGRHFRSKYDLIHVHSVPDFEVFAAIIPKVTGAKIILDIHDIVPEFYACKFDALPTSLVYTALVFVEKVCARFADHVIISNHIWEKKLVGRSAEKEKCTTFLNYPDPAFFYHRPCTQNDSKCVIIYPGSLNWHQGLDIAIKAFHIAQKELGDAEFHIYGDGPEENSLRTLVAELGLEEKILFKGSLPLDDISKVMAEACVGVVPKRNDNFGGEAFSTKVLEFMALGVPIVLSKTKIDDYYFNDSIVHFFEPENCSDLARAFVLLVNNVDERQRLAFNALEFVRDFSWDLKKHDYFALIGDMCK